MKILVVEARGLPVGFLGSYGNDWVATPALDRLAAQGVVFDRHIAHHPDLADETPTWRHAELATNATIPDLAGFAKAALAAWKRRKTPVLWIDGPNLAPPWSLDEDLLASYCDEDAEPWPDPPTGLIATQDGAETIRLYDTFAAVVTFFDAQLDQLLSALPKDDVLVCVTARSGLALGEHGMIGPARAWLHEETVHVPLVMGLPGAAHAGLRAQALTQPLDLAATLLDWLGHSAALGSGHSLRPLLEEKIEAIRPFACSRLTVGASAEWSLRTPEWALLLPMSVPAGDAPRPPRLYVKPDDRWEVSEVRQQHPEVAEELERTLRAAPLQ